MLSSEFSLSWTECSDPESVWLSGPAILENKFIWNQRNRYKLFLHILYLLFTIILDAVSRLHPRVLTGLLPSPDVTGVTSVTGVVADSLAHQQIGHHWNNVVFVQAFESGLKWKPSSQSSVDDDKCPEHLWPSLSHSVAPFIIYLSSLRSPRDRGSENNVWVLTYHKHFDETLSNPHPRCWNWA